MRSRALATLVLAVAGTGWLQSGAPATVAESAVDAHRPVSGLSLALSLASAPLTYLAPGPGVDPGTFQPTFAQISGGGAPQVISVTGGGGPTVYCSTGPGDLNPCSAGPAPSVKCSAMNGTPASNSNCSAQDSPAAACSSYGGSGAKFCSSFGQASNCSAAGSGSECSTKNGSGKCSVKDPGITGGGHNTCSAFDLGGGSGPGQCSSFDGTNTCSVSKDDAQAVCTAFFGAPEESCSTFGGAKGACSVIHDTGKVEPPVDGVCDGDGVPDT